MRPALVMTLSAAAVVAAVGAASAADVYLPPPARPPITAPPPPPSVYDWTGFYLGVQGGGDFNRAATDPPFAFTADIDGALVGLYGGYNWQSGQMVFGIDASINYDWADGPAIASGGADTGYDGEVDWKGFVRARLGFAMNNVLIYGTAGGTWADLKLVDPGGSTVEDPTAWGWTVGAGAEVGFTSHLTGRIDYAYSDYGTYSYTAPVAFTASNNSHTVTAGLALKY